MSVNNENDTYLEIKEVRGKGRVTKAEFKSGPLQLGSTTQIERTLNGFRIPFSGPGNTIGMEREVTVYLTLEGGPEFSGMVYYY